MNRWKLWSSIAASLLSIGGGSTYFIWNRQPAEATEQLAEAGDLSPHAQPPEPIHDRSNASQYSPFVAPASFNQPTASADGTSRGNRVTDLPETTPSDTPPPRPQLGGNSNPGSAEAQPPFNSSNSRYGQPQADAPGATVEPAAPVVDSSNEFVPIQNPAPLPETDATALAVPTAEGDTSSTPGAGVESTDSVAPAAEEVAEKGASPQAAPPKPLIQQPAPQPTATERTPSELPAEPSAPAELASPPSHFSESRRPTAPKLKSRIPESNSARVTTPAATLPQTHAPSAEAPARRPLNSRNPVVAPRASVLTSSTPGERKFEGLQSPSLSIERERPDETQVGKTAKFVIKVRNVGQVAAQNVVVTDQVPQGTRFLSASPETVPSADGSLVWELGVLQPNEDATLTVELMPEVEGEIGSVAELTFRIPTSVRTIATKPLLKVEHTGPAKVLIGQDVPFQITVSNPGSGIATGVVIEVDVPEGLTHDGGREIMSDRFDLRPNESKRLDLILKAAQPGVVQNVVRAIGDASLVAEHRTQLEVLAPELQVATAGPTKRFLDRPVKYQIGVSNPGTAAANNIELVARLPRGLKFTAADKKGQYDPRQHAVLWSLEELPAGEQGMVELTAIPTDTGEQKLHIEARASLGLEFQHDHVTLVEDITDLVFTVSDENVPIEVGSDTTYQIRVANNGTKVASNVRLSVTVPQGLEITDSDGPSQVEMQGDQLVMQPIAQLAQGEEAVYRLTAKGTRAGDQVLRVQLLSDEFSTPVTKEEITKVYADK